MFIHTDNVAACAIIKKGTCPNRTVMDSLRLIFLLSAIFNFRLKCVNYPGDRNKQASSENLCSPPLSVESQPQNPEFRNISENLHP